MDWQVITAISSTVIALCALGFSVWHGVQSRKHNKLSFRPHLTTWTQRNVEKGFYAIELTNNGLGPAVIDDFAVYVDGKRICGRGTEPIERGLKIIFPNSPYQAHHSYVAKGYSMAPKERCTLVAVQFLGPQLPSIEFLEHAFSRGDLEISYKSFYDECFYLSTQKEKINRSSKPTE